MYFSPSRISPAVSEDMFPVGSTRVLLTFVVIVWSLDHTQPRSGLTPGSVLRAHSWGAQNRRECWGSNWDQRAGEIVQWAAHLP